MTAVRPTQQDTLSNMLPRKQVLLDILLIFLLAFAVRLAFVIVVWPVYHNSIDPSIDPERFGVQATNIVEGRGYTDPDGTPRVWREPLYPFFMAGLWTLGGQSREIIQVANSALGGLAAALTYLLARYSFGRGAGWCAALLYSFFPLNIWYASLYRYETLFTSLVVLCGLFYLKLREQLHWRYAVLTGITLGLATLNSQVVLLIPSVFIVASLTNPHRKQLLVRVFVAMLVMVLVISPWTLRNSMVTGGKFIIVRQGGPWNFMLGNYAVAHYDEAPMQLTSLRELGQRYYEARILEITKAASIDEVDSFQREKILSQEVSDFILNHPEQFAWKVAVQSVRLWYLGDTTSKSMLILFLNVPLLILTLLGIIYAARQRKPFFLYLLVIAYFVLVYSAVWVEARYTVPLEPYLMALAGYGLLSSYASIRSWIYSRSAFRHVSSRIATGGSN